MLIEGIDLRQPKMVLNCLISYVRDTLQTASIPGTGIASTCTEVSRAPQGSAYMHENLPVTMKIPDLCCKCKSEQMH